MTKYIKPAQMTRLALMILYDSCALEITLYKAGDIYGYPMLQPADANGAKYAKIGRDIRLIEII
jgi:hypothetical protein